MSTVQNIARHVLADSVYNRVRHESQNWLMRCPCGHQTSVWEMGGLRWKADGKAVRWGRCQGCGERYFGQIYRRPEESDPSSPSRNGDRTMNPTVSQREITLDRPGVIVRLWIDGVGCWLLCSMPQVTFGGPVEPGSSQPSADICLMANLRRQHANIERTGESYRLESVQGTIDGQSIRGDVFLRDGDLVTLGEKVGMRFRQPSVLSVSSTLTPDQQSWPRMFTAGQTPGSIDGIVLMDEVCLLGPGSDAHIPCPDWEQQVILHRRDGVLWCRTAARAQMDSRAMSDAAPVTDGVVISGDGWRFRVEVAGSQGISTTQSGSIR